MKVIILIAGRGSRLSPLTDTIPKSLLPIGDSTALKRNIQSFAELGVTDFVLVVGYKQEMIRQYVVENFPELKVSYVVKDSFGQTNTGYSLMVTEPFIGDESFIKIDGDVVCDPTIAKRLIEAEEDCNYVCIDRSTIDEEVIKVSLDREGIVSRIGKDIAIHDAIGESIGIEKIAAASKNALFRCLRDLMKIEENKNEYYEIAYDKMLRDKLCQFKCIDITGIPWVEMDTVQDYELAQKLFG